MGENRKLIHMLVIQILVIFFLVSYMWINWQIMKMNADNTTASSGLDLKNEEEKRLAQSRANQHSPDAWWSYFNSADYPTHFATFIFACIALLVLVVLFINYQFEARVQHWHKFKLFIYYLHTLYIICIYIYIILY